jgi:putative salt-induced outer membrane protein
MSAMKSLIALFVVFAMATGVCAQEKKWSDQAELSFVDTGGNTEVTSLSAKNVLQYKFSEKVQAEWKLGALYGETDGEKTAESYFSDLRLDYLFTERFYSFVLGGWSQDEFAGIDSRYYAGPGLGYKFLKGPKHILLGEVGANYVNEEYTDDTDEGYTEGRAYASYEYAFTEKNRFSQSVEYLHDFEDGDNYTVNSETALISALSDYLSLKTSYVIKYDNQPIPSTLEEKDTILSVTLVVNF